MKFYITFFLCRSFFMIIFCSAAYSQNETFIKRTVAAGLDSPWEITYGPHDSLWITENMNYLVKRINVSDGKSTTLLDLSSAKNFTPQKGRWPQGGLMGMAIHPNLFSEDPAVRAAKPWVYLAYVYERISGQNCDTVGSSDEPCFFRTRIVRYTYIGDSLVHPVIMLGNLPGSNDHNSGRMVIGPEMEKAKDGRDLQYRLYYTIGDMGAGQFNNDFRKNNAQKINVPEGKILRLNTEPDHDTGADAWVPDDNPFYNKTSMAPEDYVYSYGHRNAQGIVWGTVNGIHHLYSCEHGNKSDDEINIIVRGGNYGWNRISGYRDNNYNGLALGGYFPIDEKGFEQPTIDPIYCMYPAEPARLAKLGFDYTTFISVAPSSIDFYASSAIPGWERSLLITTLKASKVFRLKLNDTGDRIIPLSSGADTASYFTGEGRFRDLAISPDGLKIYIACDKGGMGIGPNGNFKQGAGLPNPGTILEFSYVNTAVKKNK
jgi:glucose/arabinose dehydrogenase